MMRPVLQCASRSDVGYNCLAARKCEWQRSPFIADVAFTLIQNANRSLTFYWSQIFRRYSFYRVPIALHGPLRLEYAARFCKFRERAGLDEGSLIQQQDQVASPHR